MCSLFPHGTFILLKSSLANVPWCLPQDSHQIWKHSKWVINEQKTQLSEGLTGLGRARAARFSV